MSQPNIVSLNNVTHRYGSGITAVTGIHLQVPSGATLLITGHSGAGKSTLLQVIRGDIIPTEGEVQVHGFATRNFSSDDRLLLRQSTGFIDQDPNFLGNTSVYENLSFFADMIGFPVDDIDGLLDRVHLGFARNMYPTELSRGQRQVLQAIRAVMHKPFLLVADEPIAHLDEQYVRTITALFEELQAMGTTLVVASHRIDVFRPFRNLIHVHLEKGRMIRSPHI